MRSDTYREFARDEWASLRAHTPLTLSLDELIALRGINDSVSLEEIADVYLPLTRLLNLHVRAARNLNSVADTFLGTPVGSRTYVVAIAGSVAVGKSTFARVLRALMAQWPDHPRVDLVTTDGFLHPNRQLEEEKLMRRKGFPESYDIGALLRFLSSIKAGMRDVRAPLYSHLSYDVLPGEFVTIDRPDILIFEGINVLQTRDLPSDGKAVPFVSDFFDFSIYIDAAEDLIHNWYVARFMRLRETAFRKPENFFHRYSQLSEDAALAIAEGLWTNINLKNLRENILPTRPRADLILRKGADHLVEEVALRKL